MNFLDRIKGIYKTPTVNIITRGERLNAFLPDQEFSTASQHCAGVLVKAIRQEKEIKGIQLKKKK